MQVFARVVDTGGFTRAADLMNMPKATVSTLVQNLEAHLGVKLLNRTTRRVTVTPDGAAYYERCVRILTDIEETESSLAHSRSTPHGRLRVDVSGAFGRRVLVPALPEFFELYPEIRLEIGCSDRPVDLIEEGVDCVVRGGEQPDSTLIARRLGVIQLITCASPDYLKRYGMPRHPHDLARHRFVNYFSAKTGRMVEWKFIRMNEEVVVDQVSHVAFNDFEALLLAGTAGLGIMRTGEALARKELQRGELVQILPDWGSEPFPIFVMYPQNRHLSAKVRVFTDWIAELCERGNSPLASSNVPDLVVQA